MKSKRFLISNIISKKNKINIQNNNNNSNVTIFNNNNFLINDKDIEEDNISTINPIVSMFAMSSYVSKKIDENNENNNINKSQLNLNSNFYLDICENNNNLNIKLNKNKIPIPKKNNYEYNQKNKIINNEYNESFINKKINNNYINITNKKIEDDPIKKDLYFNLLNKLKNLKNNISSNIQNYTILLKNKHDKIIKNNLNNNKLQNYLKIKKQKIIKKYIFLFFNVVKNQIKLKNTLIYLKNKRNKKNVFNFLKKIKK